MGDIISSIFILPVRVLAIFTVAILVMLWIVSIIWVNKDARQRNTSAILWTIISIIPVGGLVAYCLLRPPLNNADEAEQGMSIELMNRQLSDYGNCPKCGEPVKVNYIACPHCCTRLRNVCPNCGRPLDPDWQMCPYCATPLARRTQGSR